MRHGGGRAGGRPLPMPLPTPLVISIHLHAAGNASGTAILLGMHPFPQVRRARRRHVWLVARAPGRFLSILSSHLSTRASCSQHEAAHPVPPGPDGRRCVCVCGRVLGVEVGGPAARPHSQQPWTAAGRPQAGGQAAPSGGLATSWLCPCLGVDAGWHCLCCERLLSLRFVALATYKGAWGELGREWPSPRICAQPPSPPLL